MHVLLSSFSGGFIYVFTDESAKEYYLNRQMNGLAQKKNIHITFVLSGQCTSSESDPQYISYVNLSKTTGVQLVQVFNKTEIGTVVNFVKDTLDARTVHTVSESAPVNGEKVLSIDVDDEMNLITIVVSGTFPTIKIYDPHGNSVTGKTKVIPGPMKVIEINKLIPGRWKVTITATAPYLPIQILTNSSITFNYGFALKLANSIEDTFDKPVKDQSNFLYIKPIPDTWSPTTVEISSTNGKTFNVFPLTPITKPESTHTEMFQTPQFKTPNTMFKIVVHGYDKNKNIIRSVTNITIDPQTPFDGGWSEWSDWSACHVKCGNGHKTRTRKCNSPAPAYGGKNCVGQKINIDYCYQPPCKRDGGWSDWSEWSDCSVTCNTGVIRRTRACNNPTPAYEGAYCLGPFQEVKPCDKGICPTHGGWSDWSDWKKCNARCGIGFKKRSRFCNNPSPLNGGKSCNGEETEVQECESKPCPPKNIQLYIRGQLNKVLVKQDVKVKTLYNPRNQKTILFTSTENILPQTDSWFPYMPFLISAVSWSLAKEKPDTLNGFSLTYGIFEQTSKIEFETGEILYVHHNTNNKKYRTFNIHVSVNGSVPLISTVDRPLFESIKEKFVQTGPGSLHSSSQNVLALNRDKIKFTWTNSIKYNASLGNMPFLQQKFTTRPKPKPWSGMNNINFSTWAIVQKVKKIQCDPGTQMDPSGQYCKVVGSV